MTTIWYTQPVNLYRLLETGRLLYLRRSQVQAIRAAGFTVRLVARCFTQNI